jgi:hypothetical protein
LLHCQSHQALDFLVGVTSAPDSGGGEIVVAVQYRKVQFEWISARKEDSAFLEMGCNRWKVFEISGRAELNDDRYDIVEATLQDKIVEKDIENEGRNLY